MDLFFSSQQVYRHIQTLQLNSANETLQLTYIPEMLAVLYPIPIYVFILQNVS